MDNFMIMQIPALGVNESFARNVVSAFVLPLEPTIEEINDLKTAVSEAVTNAVVHAYADATSGEVEIKCTQTGRSVTIIVKDFGCGIKDVEAAKEPFFTTRPEDERSGMGFTIMSTFMDDVKVKSEEGCGTEVIMTKAFKEC